MSPINSEEEFKRKLAVVIKNETFESIHKSLNIFDPFEVLKIQRYELRHTTILAWLLDPRETHGLEDNFLQNFIKEITSKFEELEKLKLNSNIAIFPEHYIDNVKNSQVNNKSATESGDLGRIDILIETEKFVLAIEAKIDDKGTKKQLEKYDVYLEKRFGHGKYIPCFKCYLTVEDKSDLLKEYDSKWKSIQWGEQLTRALQATLQENLGNEDNQEKTNSRTDFLKKYLNLLQSLNVKSLSVEGAQKLADANYQILFDLRTRIEDLKTEPHSMRPWNAELPWIQTYWNNHKAFDYLFNKIRDPEAVLIWGIFEELQNRYQPTESLIIHSGAPKDQELTFSPMNWQETTFGNPTGGIFLRYKLAYVKTNKGMHQIELKLYLEKLDIKAQEKFLNKIIEKASGKFVSKKPFNFELINLKKFIMDDNKSVKIFYQQLNFEPGQKFIDIVGKFLNDIKISMSDIDRHFGDKKGSL